MKNIKLLKDSYLLKQLLSDVYDEMVYDDSVPLSEYVPSGVWFLLTENHHSAGLINLERLNNVTWIPHIIIYEEYRGNDSYEWGLKVADYMKRNLGAKKLLALTPYVQAKRYAEKMGFKYLSRLTKSIQKNGKLLDQYVLEMTL